MKNILLSAIMGIGISIAAADKPPALSQADKDVDSILSRMVGSPNAQNSAINDIRKIGKAGVPRLIEHVQTDFVIQKQSANFGGQGQSFSRETKVPNPKKLMALFLLQHVWADEAAAPLESILKKDSNQEARLLALAALNRNARETLLPLFPELAKDQNAEIAAIAFEQLELQKPDEKRMLELLNRQSSWKSLELYLPRYYSASLTPKTISMLKSAKSNDEKSAAIVSLISQNANSPDIRKHISDLIKAYDPGIREICAEYLTWHGTASEIPILETALKTEQDLHAAASIASAIKSIKRRDIVKDGGSVPFPSAFEEASKLMESGRRGGDVAEAMKLLQSEPFEPLHILGKGSDEFMRQREARMKLTGLVFCMPLFSGNEEKSPAKDAARADSLVPPVRDYFDLGRKAYGAKVSPAQNLVRLGDNAGFRKTYQTAVSIGDGTVKFAGYDQKMGYTVIIEHTTSDGKTFCSLYSHLSPFIHVRNGDIVARGEKIGAIGRHFTWENGGYGAHLYFGIFTDAFGACPNWQITYIPEEDFIKGTKWANPQMFLQQRIRK